MQEIKETIGDHREFVHGPESSPSTSGNTSDGRTPDPEKTAQVGVDSGHPRLHDDDTVTVKTWAIVVVGSLPTRFSTTLDHFAGARSILRHLVVACPLYQHHSSGYGS